MADEEQNLLLEDGEGENGGVDEGLIIQLSKRDSTSVTNRQTRRRRSTEVSQMYIVNGRINLTYTIHVVRGGGTGGAGGAIAPPPPK